VSQPEKAVLIVGPGLPSSVPAGCGRVYLGDEFCERLIPSPSMLERAFAWSVANRIGLTLVTPYLSDSGIQPFTAALAVLAGTGERMEVVVNDWGGLRLARERLPGRIEIILGRSLVAGAASHVHPLPEAFLDFVVRQGIESLEFNSLALLAVNKRGASERGLRCHVHHPFEYLAATRYCVFASEPEACLRDAIAACARECAGRYAFLEDGGAARAHVFVKGNACFLKQHSLDGAIDADRIVDNTGLIAFP
jgi:hypothetical protein